MGLASLRASADSVGIKGAVGSPSWEEGRPAFPYRGVAVIVICTSIKWWHVWNKLWLWLYLLNTQIVGLVSPWEKFKMGLHGF